MTSWREELPADLPREKMMVEAVRRGIVRRRDRHRRNAALEAPASSCSWS